MMEPEQDEPFARESWQRLLREGDDAPSEATDLRIRAAARRALASRPVRWWVPASLAASFVLVVMLVQSQYAGLSRQQAVGESDVSARTAPNVILNAPAADSDAPAAAFEAPAESTEAKPADAPGPAAPEQGFTASPPASAPLAPMMDVPMPPASEEREAYELKRDRADSAAPAVQEAVAPSPRSSAIGNLDAAKSSGLRTRTPEAWYAEIEALRTAGRVEEAEAELEKLEAAHPGWLADRHPPKP